PWIAWDGVGGGIRTPAPTAGVAADVASPFFRPIWWGGGGGSLIAFDVSNDTQPKFASRVTLNVTNGWWSFSPALATDGLVYLSHQATERIVTGGQWQQQANTTWLTETNIYAKTNLTDVTTDVVTNITWVTNVVSVPETVTTNVFVPIEEWI